MMHKSSAMNWAPNLSSRHPPGAPKKRVESQSVKRYMSITKIIGTHLKRIFLRSTVVIFVFGLGLPCYAARVNVDGRVITLTIPAGHCMLDATHPVDAELLRYREANSVAAKTELRFLARFVGCDDLQLLRRGELRTFARHGQIAVPKNGNGSALIIPGTRQQFLASYQGSSNSTASLLSKNFPSAVARAEATLGPGGKKLQVQIPIHLLTDNNATYMYSNASMVVDGQQFFLLGVIATTLIQNVQVIIYTFEQYSGHPPIGKLLALQQKTMAAFIKANG